MMVIWKQGHLKARPALGMRNEAFRRLGEVSVVSNGHFWFGKNDVKHTTDNPLQPLRPP